MMSKAVSFLRFWFVIFCMYWSVPVCAILYR